MVKLAFSQLGNDTLIDAISRELPQSTFYWMLISLVLAIVWVVYLTYYNSRVMGLILTAILNRFIKIGHVRFGSFSFSVLSGKIMFRDFHLVTEDFSVRIQLGLAIFRWWRPITAKNIYEDLIHEETRLTLCLDTFEMHVYNRSSTYARLEELFGLERKIIPKKDDEKCKKKDKGNTIENTEMLIKNKWLWRILMPVIKVEVSSGRIVFGNYLLPTTLSINIGDSHFLYSTKQASTPFDQFMHIIKGNTDNIRIMLVPSPKYRPQEDKIDEAPRFMGDGFVLFQSQKVDVYYYRDEPGLVPHEIESLLMANGDVLRRRTWPVSGVEVKCDKMTDISYGPWADRQREYLWKFFFPAEYQTMKVTQLPEPGQVRMYRHFDFKMSLQTDATVDILFTKNKETQALHMSCKKGSYLEFTIPYITDESGYQTKISGMLIALDATTSLPFRSFLECETLEVDVQVKYPRHWNDHQNWCCDIKASKASAYLVYQHKNFIADLVDDWSNKSRPDVYHFIPYTWKVNVILQEFELVTLTNQWNWIDCHGATPENAHLAVCGETFELTFDLPGHDFVPLVVPIKIFIRGEDLSIRMYLPETNTSRHLVLALSDNCRLLGRDGVIHSGPLGDQNSKKWRRVTQRSFGWVDCWLTPIVALSINYTYHPVPALGSQDKYATPEAINTPDAEEQLLIPLRLYPLHPLKRTKEQVSEEDFDPTYMDSDEISVELEVGPSEICLYGALLKNLWHIKEGYFGDDQKFTDFKETFTSRESASTFDHIINTPANKKSFDPRRYRPLHTRVQVTLYDMHGHMMKHCKEGDPPCPSIFLERLGFEMNKHYTETKLQVMLSPATIYVRDQYQDRPESHGHLQDGHVMLTAIQIRGNALFSHKGLPLDYETLEYTWLLEITIGDLIGRLTAPQLQMVIEFLQTLAFGTEDAENNLQHPRQYRYCQHGLIQHECTIDPSSVSCLTPDDVKYRMTRVTMDCVDLYLVESGAALNIQVYPIRMSTCNLHGKNNKAGITVLIPNVKMKQFVLSIPTNYSYNSQSDVWLEAGGVSLGPINIDAAMALPGPEFHPMQDRFLKLHDEKTHRLWFLWSKEELTKDARAQGKCGCIGGCAFFGSNRNGPNVFHPSDRDFTDSINAAVFYVCPDDSAFCFGQSLLQKGQLIFNANSGLSTFPMTPRKCHGLVHNHVGLCESKISMDTSRTSNTIGDTSSPPTSLCTDSFDRTGETIKSNNSHISDTTLVPDFESQTQGLPPPIPSRRSNPTNGDVLSQRSSLLSDNVASDGVPSEYIPDSSIPDAYDTDRYVSTPSDATSWPSAASGSASSLPDMVSPLREKCHERKFSDPPFTKQQKSSMEQSSSVSGGNSMPSSLSSESRRSSKNSIPSVSGNSRQSSLTSPVLRRLSSQLSILKYSSTASMTGSGSERFFSACEDLTGSMQTISSEFNSPYSSLHRPPLSRQNQITLESTGAGSQRSRSYSPENVSLSSSYYGDVDSPRSSMYTHRERTESEASNSSSDSATSFVSALSSQRASRHSVHHIASGSSSQTINAEDPVPDLGPDPDPDVDHDLDCGLPASSNYVNLHGQINQPITKSVLLTNCYINHMTQLQCSYWSAPPPLPGHMLQWKGMRDGNISSGSKQAQTPGSIVTGNMQTPTWIPHYSYLNQGFSPTLMVNKKDERSPPRPRSPFTTSEYAKKDNKFFPSDENLHDTDTDSMFTYENHVSKTTAVVNLKGSIDVMVSPLMLEALQRYVEAVTPVLQNLHPSTIVDAMHFKVVNSVKAQNKLKQQENDGEGTDRKDDKESSVKVEAEQVDFTGKREDKEKKTSRLQVMFSLSRVNICLIQASLVEEIVSIAALDNAKDLMCVSILAACFDNISCQLLTNNISQKALEPVLDSSPDSSTKKNIVTAVPSRLGSLGKQSSMASDGGEREQIIERQQEDMVGSLSIGRIHFQLRRMKKNSNFSNHVFLTAIPEYRSKVFFTFEKPPVPIGDFTGTGTLTPMKGPCQSTNGEEVQHAPREHDFEKEGLVAEGIAGFIMLECGLEDISLRAARRTGYSSSSPEEDIVRCSDQHLDNDEQKQAQEYGTQSDEKLLESNSESESSSQDCGNAADDEASGNTEHSDTDNSTVNPDLSQGKASTMGTGQDGQGEVSNELTGDASSGVLKVKSVWFNFAAPPPSPKKKKLEYTRLDWNLLSTATPAINSWMSPSDRAFVAAKTLMQKLNERICVVMACIMTEGPETSGIHNRVKSKVNKLTSLSSTLQEDPSCQLITALRHYISKVGIKVIEDSVNVDTLPQLVTIKKGLLVITRQWKNILYMPRLSSNSFKNKRSKVYNVNFQLPADKSIDGFSTAAPVDDWDASADNFMVVDEKTSLLKAEDGSVHTPSVYSMALSGQPMHTGSTRPEESKVKTKLLGVPSASNLSTTVLEGELVSPAITSQTSTNQVLNSNIKQQACNISQASSSSSSVCSTEHYGTATSAPGTPHRQSLAPHLSQLDRDRGKDVGSWTTQQQQYMAEHAHPGFYCYPSMGQDSLMYAGISEYSHDDSTTITPFFMHPAVQMQDAQVLFKPLLKAIGLQMEAIKMSAMMKKFGGNISVRSHLQTLRIEIVDSESGTMTKPQGRDKSRGKKTTECRIDTSFDKPAFQTDALAFMVDMKDIVDFEKSKEEKKSEAEFMEMRRRSLRTFRFAMDHLEAKPTTMRVNCSFNCNAVTQHINMSLLRLIHQFVTMIENIHETQTELKERHTHTYTRHKKQDSKGSSTETGTDIHSVNQLDDDHPPAGDTSISTPSHIVTEQHSPMQRPSDLPLTDLHARPDKLPISGGFTTKTPRKLSGKKHKLDSSSSRQSSNDQKTEEMLNSPIHSIESVIIDMADTSSPALAEKTIVDQIRENTPLCWIKLYHLLNLYSTMPDMKTVTKKPSQSRLSIIAEECEKDSQNQPTAKQDPLVAKEMGDDIDAVERQQRKVVPGKTYQKSTFTHSLLIGAEHVPLIVFCIAKLKRIKITAVLSGLTLEADLQNVHGSATHRERVKGLPKKRSRETSASAHVGHTMIALIEGHAPELQTIVTINISKSQGLYSSFTKRSHEYNSCLITVGCIGVDIPQHPVALHGMFARSSKRITNTLQEFIRVPSRVKSHDTPDGAMPTKPLSKHSELNDLLTSSTRAQESSQLPSKPVPPSRPITIHFKAILKGLTIGASLLPSLKAEYKMGRVFSSGVTGKKARFTVDLPIHSLSFESKINTPSNLPSSANVVLPPIHVHGDYKEYSPESGRRMEAFAEGLTLREGPYLNAAAEVGAFEHSLTTDLLNHLVFVQKVFMKEVNELVQKVSGADQPVPLWHEESVQVPKSLHKPMLFHFKFRLKGIQITATTPTDNAVRLETDMIELELSNRVLSVRQCQKPVGSNYKVFVKAQVVLNVSLGTLVRNPLFHEAEPDFPHLASFNTTISLRNALQDEMIPGVSKDQEALLISLKRPIVFIQPAAFDKAVLVWLNYKNAYEYWNEQRMVLNKEEQTAPQQSTDRLSMGHNTQTTSSASGSGVGTLYLQLTVDDLGICLPSIPFSQAVTTTSKVLEDPGASLVLTLQQTQVSACSCGSLVSKGKFTGFCLRFDEDFEKSWDDWKPSKSQKVVMNAMVVPEGTYEVCSRTINPHNDENSNAKVILNVKWHMRGLDINMDTNIGKRLSQLGSTLTSLTSDHDIYMDGVVPEDPEVRKPDDPSSISEELLEELGYGANMNSKQWTRLIEKKMNDQAKVVDDLKQLGASQSTIGTEQRKLEELKMAVCHDFRQDLMKKLRRKSVKASVKDKIRLSYKPSHLPQKSKSHSGYHRPMTLDVRKLMSFQEESGRNQITPITLAHTHNRTMSLDMHAMNSTPKVRWDRSPLSMFSTTFDDSVYLAEESSSSTQATPDSPPYVALQYDGSSSSGDNNDPDLIFHRNTAVRICENAESESCIHTVPSPSQGSGGSQKAPEPSIDFELDVKVEVDSGLCVLYPKESKLEGEPEKLRVVRSQKDLQQISPRSERKKTNMKYTTDSMLSSRTHQPPPLTNLTTFVLPGVDVKVHWNSKTSKSEMTSYSSVQPDQIPAFETSVTPGSSGSNMSASKKNQHKKANLYAWLSLQQLPEEMLIRPVLLDFLEQALEPIPMLSSKNNSKNSTLRTSVHQNTVDLDASATSLVSTGNYTSFPVDVVVYLLVKPSLIRFTCLPVSRVECLLRLPSLDVVFSTKKADDEPSGLPESDPASKGKVGLRLTTSNSSLGLRAGKTATRTRSASGHQQDTVLTSGGGLSVTACLADFSLFVFHPYGGGQKKTSLSALESRFKKSRGADGSYSQASDAGRKDSLSLNVEFVKVNLSRSLKGVIQTDVQSGSNNSKQSGNESQSKAANSVRFSAVCDVGSASFKYDMRRLSEILALPKAWYRRTLARRMFLGEERVLDSEEEEDEYEEGLSSSSPPTPDSPLFSPYGRAQTFNTVHYPSDKPSKHRRAVSADKNIPVMMDLKRDLREPSFRQHKRTGSAPQSPGEDQLRSPRAMTQPSTPSMLPPRVQQEYIKLRERDLLGNVKQTSRFTMPISPGLSSQKSVRDWETLVLFAINLSQLDVIVNMSNVMGNTVWSTKDLKSEGSMSMDSTGARNMSIVARLGGSKLEAKGGIVGGNIALQKLQASVSIKEEPCREPEHRASFQLDTLETRLDYMGSSILLGRTSSLSVELKDEWKIQACRLDDSDPDMVATRRPATIFVYGELDWDKFHLMISRSTTPDLIKMVTKLEEFFAQQLNSSKRVLSLIPGGTKPKKKKDNEEASWMSEIRHHRHWQRVLDRVSGCKLSMLSFTLPSHRSTVGGSMSLKGSNLSLACFHGINFRSKSWGLFTMEEPYITFITEAQEVVDDDGAKCTHVEQTLQFRLGHEHRNQHSMNRKNMAQVCKLSRGHYMPPPMTNVQEWFHYAFATSEIRDLDSFPPMAREGSESPLERRMSSRRGQEYNHDTEIIFKLPSLLMVLKTRHLQGDNVPDDEDSRPNVECSFVTDFYHHINVAMDAEAILFIHDLVTSYVREKDKGANRVPKSPEVDRKNVSNPTTVLKQDHREFNTISWRLEPTVNLLTWAGKNIDPVGVDYILQKLGFQHARLTIPKWMQRGCMDPLDKVLSLLVDKLILVLREQANNEVEDEDDD